MSLEPKCQRCDWAKDCDDADEDVVFADRLRTARKINGTAFDGTGDITTAKWGQARNISISDADGTNLGEAVSVNGSKAVTLKLPANIKANIAGNADTASVTATGSTAARGIADRFADIVNVKDFGAKGDGVTDDSAAFQAAGATGKTVVVPAGSYRVDSQADGHFFSLGDVTLSSRFVQVVNKRMAGSYAPIDIVGGPSHAKIILRSDQRGSGSYSRAAVQSAAFDPVGNQIFMLHQKATFDEEHLARYASISRHPLKWDLDVGTSGISADLDEVGHQGLAVEVLPTGGIKLWGSSNYGLHGGTALRFDYNDSADVSNIQEYILVDDSRDHALTPCISSDQRLLIVGCLKNDDLFLRVFDLAALREGGAGDYSGAYLAEFPVYPLKQSGVIGFQGMACDGWHVYILASDTSTSTPAAIYCYSIQGELIAKNTNVTLGFAESAAIGSTWCEAETLLLMPVDNELRLCVGVNVASSVGDAGTAPTKNFHIFALGCADGWRGNPQMPNERYLESGTDLSTFRASGFYIKAVNDGTLNWPDIGTNGMLLNFGNNDGTGFCFQLACRIGTLDATNYQAAYRVNSYNTATRWWYLPTMFARCHVAANGTLSGRQVNIASVTQVSGTEYTITLNDEVDLSSVVVISPTYSASVVTGSGSIGSDGKTISVRLSAQAPFSMVIF